MRKFFEYLKVTLWQCRVKTCCSVAPLRIGLICLGYIHVIVSLVQLVGVAAGAAYFMPMLAHVQGDLLDDDPSQAVCLLPPAADLAFSAVLLCGLYRRDLALLRVYSWYGVICIILSFMVYGLLEAVINTLYLLVIVIVGFYQVYILVLVRSLMIEIHLQTVADKTKFLYDKGREVVIIRDVESPTPGQLPALMAPELATSITTLNENSAIPAESRYSTLSKAGTLRTATLNSYRAKEPTEIIVQKSATLPLKDTAIVHRQLNTQRIGAVQSLAGSSASKSVDNNTLKRDTSTASAVTTTVEVNNNPEIKNKTDIKETEVAQSKTESENKVKDESKKVKRGLFSRSPKEQSQKDKDSVPNNQTSTAQPLDGKTDTLENNASKTVVATPTTIEPTTITAITKTDDDNKIETIEEVIIETNEDKTKEKAPQKKKRGIFKKTSKVNAKKNDKKGDE